MTKDKRYNDAHISPEDAQNIIMFLCDFLNECE